VSLSKSLPHNYFVGADFVAQQVEEREEEKSERERGPGVRKVVSSSESVSERPTCEVGVVRRARGGRSFLFGLWD
jgi:hypothetical protein